MSRSAARYATLVLLLAGLTWTGGAAGAEQTTAADTSAANEELAGITERLNALRAWFNTAERRRNQWQQELRTADTRVAELGLEVTELRRAQQAIEARIRQLAADAADLEVRRDTQAERISTHLRAAQRSTGTDFFKQLINQQDPIEIDRMLRYHQFFSTARADSLQAFQKTLTELAANRAAADSERTRLVAQRREVTASQREFESQRRQRKDLLARLAAEVRDNTAEQQRLEADRVRLSTLLTEIARRAEALDGAEFEARRGRLVWPASGDVRSAYGQARTEGRMRWQGTHIATAESSPVHAVHRGKVVFAEWLRGFGLLTIIDHGNDYMTLYGYADVLLKRPGDWVESGEPIANSGTSGGQAVHGVYFEIRHRGEPVDPTGWLQPLS